MQNNNNEQSLKRKSIRLPLSNNISDNIKRIKENFKNSFDLSQRDFLFGADQHRVKISLFFINGLTDKESLESNVLWAFSYKRAVDLLNKESDINTLATLIQNNILTSLDIKKVDDYHKLLHAILMGKCILLIDGISFCYEIDTRKWNERNVDSPKNDTIVKGPHEGFTENILTNTALIRRILKTPDLILEMARQGEYSKTDIVIAYIKGIVNTEIVEEVRYRLSKINIDGILDSSYVEQLIQDAPLSLFSTTGYTERPDVACAKLLEGRIAIIVDGSPNIVTVPYLMIENLQSPNDYYIRPWAASFFRLVRLICLIITVLLPGLYIAFQTFHPDIIPTHLLVTMAAAKEGIPFPASIEIILMSLLFEVLKEAGKRMPVTVGQAVNIVGALIIGQAAVDAGFVSNPSVMITALAGISSFVVYRLDEPIIIVRFTLIFTAAYAGLFGMLIASLFILIHLASLRSFGVPYLSPITPTSIEGLKNDTLIRSPIWSMKYRPNSILFKYSKRNATRKPSSKHRN